MSKVAKLIAIAKYNLHSFAAGQECGIGHGCAGAPPSNEEFYHNGYNIGAIVASFNPISGSFNSLPDPVATVQSDPEVTKTLERIGSRSGKYAEDGSTFQNREGNLPLNDDPAYYTEWTVDTPGAKGRGSQRIVVGKNGETYYSGDHYRSFVDITQKKP